MIIYNSDKTEQLDEAAIDYSSGLVWATDEHDENGDIICVFVPFTEREKCERKIADLKSLLASTDYKAIKLAEGKISAEEYAPIEAERDAWRAEINELKQQLLEDKA